MIAPTETYTPPPISLIRSREARTSLRNCFFSDELSLDLSMALISSNRSSSAFASAASLALIVFVLAGLVAVAACD